MAKQSAGIAAYRIKNSVVEVLLVHPGGPFWARRDAGVWSIPKGEFSDGEEPLVAAKREFREETGHTAPEGTYIDLGQAKQSGGKIVYAWAVPADIDASSITSNMFTIEWPPKSGQRQEFPEVDRAAWFSLVKAKTQLVKGQVPLLEALAKALNQTLETTEPPTQSSLF